MTQIVPQTQTIFDTLRRVRADGSEFWSARDLMAVLGYQRWENAQVALTRAIEACERNKHASDTHFRATTKKVKLGGNAQRDVLDYHLTRYAAYLAAMNGDTGKDEVALAQNYFAVQARSAEVMQAQAIAEPVDPMLAQLEMMMQVRRQQLALETRVASQEQQLAEVQTILDNRPITGSQPNAIKSRVARLAKLMGGKPTHYSQAWRRFKDRFDVASYRDLPARLFDEGVRFLDIQIESYGGGDLFAGGDQ